MDRYYFSADQHKAYKLHANNGKADLFWVQVYQLTNGSFFHGRGMERLETFEKALEACELMAKPCGEEVYLEKLKDYFAIDKKIREAFIKKYKL